MWQIHLGHISFPGNAGEVAPNRNALSLGRLMCSRLPCEGVGAQSIEVHSEELQSTRVFIYVSVCSFSRESFHEKQTSSCLSTGVLADIPNDDELKVGIIGGGHLGKQLARVLLQLVPIPAENLRISTRRPEALGEEQCVAERGSGVDEAILKGSLEKGTPAQRC